MNSRLEFQPRYYRWHNDPSFDIKNRERFADIREYLEFGKDDLEDEFYWPEFISENFHGRILYT